MLVKSRAQKKTRGDEISAERPILTRKPLTEALSAVSAKVTHIHRNGGLKAPQQLTEAEEQLRKMFAKMAMVEVIPEVEARLGSDGDEQDEQVFLDAALAHGNPISRYIRTRKEEDRTDLDVVDVDGVPCRAPMRMRRCIVGHDSKGNYTWGLLRDYVIETRITIEKKGAILTWVPIELQAKSAGFVKMHRTTTRRHTVTLRYHPSEKIKTLQYSIDKKCEKQVESDTRNVPGYYGVENLRSEQEELQRFAGIKVTEVREPPDSMHTWLEGEDREALKKKANKKTWASKKERMANNRTSWAFPSQLDYRPPPNRAWLLNHPDGKSHLYGDDTPWPNDIVAPDAWDCLKEHNARAAEWANNEKYLLDHNTTTEEVMARLETPAITTSLVTDASVNDGKRMEVIVVPERYSVIPEAKPVQRTLLKMDRPPLIPEKQEPPHWVTHRDKVRRHALSQFLSPVEEVASQLPVLEGEQIYIPKEEVGREEIALVRNATVKFLTAEKNERARRIPMALPAPKPTANAIGPRAVGAPRLRIVTEQGNLDYDLSDPGIFEQFDEQFKAIQKRIGALALVEDVLEEARETAMRLQGKLGEHDRYIRHDSLEVGMGGYTVYSDTFGQAQARSTTRLMVHGDLWINTIDLGGIRYGHGRERNRSGVKPGIARLSDTIAEIELAEKKAANIARSKEKQAKKILMGQNRRYRAKNAMKAYLLRKEWDTSLKAVEDRIRDHKLKILHDAVQYKTLSWRADFRQEKSTAFMGKELYNLKQRGVGRMRARMRKCSRQHDEWLKNREQEQVNRIMRGARYMRYNLENGGLALRLNREHRRDIDDYLKKVASQAQLDRIITQAQKLQEEQLVEERMLLRKSRRKKHEAAELVRKIREDARSKPKEKFFGKVKTALKEAYERAWLGKPSAGGTVREAVIPIVTVAPIQPVVSETQPSKPVPITRMPARKQAARVEERAMQKVALEVIGGLVFDRTESGIILPTKYVVPADGDRLANVFDKVRGI